MAGQEGDREGQGLCRVRLTGAGTGQGLVATGGTSPSPLAARPCPAGTRRRIGSPDRARAGERHGRPTAVQIAAGPAQDRAPDYGPSDRPASGTLRAAAALPVLLARGQRPARAATRLHEGQALHQRRPLRPAQGGLLSTCRTVPCAPITPCTPSPAGRKGRQTTGQRASVTPGPRRHLRLEDAAPACCRLASPGAAGRPGQPQDSLGRAHSPAGGHERGAHRPVSGAAGRRSRRRRAHHREAPRAARPGPLGLLLLRPCPGRRRLQRPNFGELLTYARPGGAVYISEMFPLVRGYQHILDVLEVLDRNLLALRIHDGAFPVMDLTARHPRSGADPRRRLRSPAGADLRRASRRRSQGQQGQTPPSPRGRHDHNHAHRLPRRPVHRRPGPRAQRRPRRRTHRPRQPPAGTRRRSRREAGAGAAGHPRHARQGGRLPSERRSGPRRAGRARPYSAARATPCATHATAPSTKRLAQPYPSPAPRHGRPARPRHRFSPHRPRPPAAPHGSRTNPDTRLLLKDLGSRPPGAVRIRGPGPVPVSRWR